MTSSGRRSVADGRDGGGSFGPRCRVVTRALRATACARFRRVAQLRPHWGVVARVVFAPNRAIDAGGDEAPGKLGAQQDLVEAQPCVALPSLPHVVPESVHRLIRMERAYSIDPTLCEKPLVGFAAPGLQQRVVVIRFGRIDVAVGRHDVGVARQHDRHACLVKRGGVPIEALHPSEFVVELGAWLRVAVRRVEGRHQYAAHRGFDVAALRVGRIARQLGARDDRRRAAGEDRDAVPALLALPHCLVARLPDRLGGELRVRGL